MIIILLIYNAFLVVAANINEKESKDIFGYKAYIIVTDSMKPNINSGDIIITKKNSKEDLKIGTVITFKNHEEIVTHRIVEIVDNEKYITKGDNNNIEDSEEVYYETIEGNVILRIPYLGNIIILLKNRIFDTVLAIAIFAIYIYIIKVEDKKKTRREKKKIEDQKFKNENLNKNNN